MEDDPARLPVVALLPRVGAAVARYRRRLAARHGLTSTAVDVLAALAAGDAPSHREMAARLGLSPATLTPVLDALEAAGQVRRERDPGDRRVVRLHRTADGEERLAEASRAVPGLPEPDLALEPALRAYLLAVLAAAEADDRPPPADDLPG